MGIVEMHVLRISSVYGGVLTIVATISEAVRHQLRHSSRPDWEQDYWYWGEDSRIFLREHVAV